MKSTLFLILCSAAVAGCQSSESPSGTAQSDQTYSNQSYSSQTANTNANTGNSAENAGYSSTPTTNPDNTAINARDQNSNLPTADNQGQSQTDIDLTSSIRRGIVDRKMSVNAQNVKIITQNGKVTLRGPVNSAQEKQAIGELAGDVAGPGNVDNELEIIPNS